MIKYLSAFLAAVLTVVVISGCTHPAAKMGKIAFVSRQFGNSDIYVMNSDGSNLTKITSIGNNGVPSWSPDGTKIAFTSFTDNQNDIFVMNADGSGQKLLTDNLASDSSPSWSPDGQKILFTSSRDFKVRTMGQEIYVMNADGTGQTRLTHYNGQCGTPHWSPDHSRIIFSFTTSQDNTGIYSVRADGTDRVTILYDDLQTNSYASYSPDGSKIVFMSIRPGVPPTALVHDIYVMSSDGSNQIRLDEKGLRDILPSWSPDGKRIVFNSDEEIKGDDNSLSRQIWVIKADGSDRTRITNIPGYNEAPVWSR